MDEIDSARLLILVKKAQKANDLRDNELGTIISSICKLVMSYPCFIGYSDDWKIEMFGDATLSIFNAINHADVSNERKLFNFIFTIARNSCRHTLKHLKNLPTPIKNEWVDVNGNFCLKNKRQEYSGMFVAKEKELLEKAQYRKPVMLKNIINMTRETFFKNLGKEKLLKLRSLAKLNRSKL